MSSTRHASDNAPLQRQERYMSCPEYAERRGLNGNLVSARCELLVSARKRSLIYFLQALSHRDGGLQKVARELIAMFPERLGTAQMRSIGIKDGREYSVKSLDRIHGDLAHYFGCHFDSLEDDRDFASMIMREIAPESIPTANGMVQGKDLMAACRRSAALKLEEYLVDFCLNPKLRFALPGESETVQDIETLHSQESNAENFSEKSDVNYFNDIVGALEEYQRRYADRIEQATVVTEIGRKVYDALDYARKTKRMIIIEGNARLGKTFAAKAWCEQNLGAARYLSVPCSNAEEDFFRAIANALGLPMSQRKNVEMRDLIDKTLKHRHIMLVLDEAHFAWPQKNIRVANPVRLNWIRTELVDKGIAVALITTPQAWKVDRNRTIKNTGWAFEQFEGRVAHRERLPAELSLDDLKAVAKSMFPAMDNPSLKYLSGMAMRTKEYLGALDAVAHRASWRAEKGGRSTVTFEDVSAAVNERLNVKPSEHESGKTAKPEIQNPVNARCTRHSEPMQPRFSIHSPGREPAVILPRSGRANLISVEEKDLVKS